MCAVRVERIKKMIERCKEQGIGNIESAEVVSLTRSDAVGRMHLAVMLKEKGWVSSIQEAFVKYIGEDCPAYVPKLKQTPFEAIALIREAGGVAMLAHPMLNNKDEHIASFVGAGLQGIEVWYPNIPAVIKEFYFS